MQQELVATLKAELADKPRLVVAVAVAVAGQQQQNDGQTCRFVLTTTTNTTTSNSMEISTVWRQNWPLESSPVGHHGEKSPAFHHPKCCRPTGCPQPAWPTCMTQQHETLEENIMLDTIISLSVEYAGLV